MILPFIGPNHYDCISSPATPQTVYGDVGNSYHVGGGYQVISGLVPRYGRCTLPPPPPLPITPSN